MDITLALKSNEFIRIAHEGAILHVVKIDGMNMKYVYHYLTTQKCTCIPDEMQQAGRIWVFDPTSKECVTMDHTMFNYIFKNSLKLGVVE